MAADYEIVNGMNDWLKARGYQCGRAYAPVDAVIQGLASLPGETTKTLEPKVRRLIADPQYRFKTRGKDEVSASDDECGRG